MYLKRDWKTGRGMEGWNGTSMQVGWGKTMGHTTATLPGPDEGPRGRNVVNLLGGTQWVRRIWGCDKGGWLYGAWVGGGAVGELSNRHVDFVWYFTRAQLIVEKRTRKNRSFHSRSSLPWSADRHNLHLVLLCLHLFSAFRSGLHWHTDTHFALRTAQGLLKVTSRCFERGGFCTMD